MQGVVLNRAASRSRYVAGSSQDGAVLTDTDRSRMLTWTAATSSRDRDPDPDRTGVFPPKYSCLETDSVSIELGRSGLSLS